jgi:uncharacterized Rossmann fold enzyme
VPFERQSAHQRETDTRPATGLEDAASRLKAGLRSTDALVSTEAVMGTEPEEPAADQETPDPAKQAAAETAATLAPAEVMPDVGITRQDLLDELEATRQERNDAFAEVESWRQGSLIAAAITLAGVLIFFWPF